MRNTKRALLPLALVLALGWSCSAAAQAKSVTLWNSQLTVTVPSKAGKPKKVATNLFSIQPTNKKNKVVLYCSREKILADEKSLTNAQLASSIKRLLESDGYKVASITSKKNVFSAKLTGYANMPWRKVGTSAVRGMAQFVRTPSGQLVGTFVLSDPKEWNNSSTLGYRKAVLSSKVK